MASFLFHARHRQRDIDRFVVRRHVAQYQLLRSTGLSILGGIGLTVVVIAILFEAEVALYLMVSVFTMLLAAAIGTAWFLLARLRI